MTRNPGGVVIGGNVINIPSALRQGAISTLNGEAIIRGPQGGVMVGQSSVTSGAIAPIGNMQISVGDGHIIVLPTTLPYVPLLLNAPQRLVSPASNDKDAIAEGPEVGAAAAAIRPSQNLGHAGLGIVAAGQTWTPLNQETVVANGATLSLGAPPMTFGVEQVSMALSVLIYDGSHIPIPTIPLTPPMTADNVIIVTAAGHILSSVKHGQLQIGGATLTAEAPATEIDGLFMSLGSSNLVVGGSTIALRTSQPLDPQPELIQAAGQTLTVIGSSQIEAEGVTIHEGASATRIGGIDVSLGSSVLVAGSSTIPFTNAPLSQVPATPVVVAGQTFTPLGPDGVAVNGKTFSLGEALTSDGTVISVANQGLVVGGSTTVAFEKATNAANSLDKGGIPSDTSTSAVSKGRKTSDALRGFIVDVNVMLSALSGLILMLRGIICWI